MTLTAGRRALTSHPRALLVVLLAFAIELLSPPSALVRHRHAGGDAPHVHAGRVAGVASPEAADDDAMRAPLAGPALAHAGPPDLHAHLAPPAVVAALPAIVPPAPALVVAPLPVVAPSGEMPAAARSRRARAPPPRAA
ncbi:MAG: hypothetical protein IT304_07160 [Dehalococcoidia bacterium]|nr:hypothetical protein [Dehalococcoidia bacterium]